MDSNFLSQLKRNPHAYFPFKNNNSNGIQRPFEPDVATAAYCNLPTDEVGIVKSTVYHEEQRFLKRLMDKLAAPNYKATMTSVPVDFKLPLSKINAHDSARDFLFKQAPYMTPSTSIADISSDIARFGQYIERAGIFPLIHYQFIEKINEGNASSIICKDSVSLISELLFVARLPRDDEIEVALASTVRYQLLLFFDKYFPVDDFIDWVEKNYQNMMLEYKTFFAYYVLKTLTLNEETYEYGSKKVNDILIHANMNCKRLMDYSFKDIFFDSPIINKFYVLATNTLRLQYVFPECELENNGVTDVDIIRTHRYKFDDENGLQTIFVESKANPDLILHNNLRKTI